VCELFDDSLSEGRVRRFAGAAHWPGPGRPAGAMADRPELPTSALDGRPPHPIAAFEAPTVLDELRERSLWSASSLENFRSCPVKWFVERLLRAEEIDPDPEPLARGGLAHAALKDTLEGLRGQRGSARLTPASLGLARRLLAEALDRHSGEFPLSAFPERLPGARRRLHVELERYLAHAAEQESPLEPSHLEIEFGFESGPQAPAESVLPPLDLGDGVQLRGRIDRVDVGEGGAAVVYDYKGRSAPPGAKWATEGAFQMALYMRAVQELLGHETVGGFYQPLAGRDLRARGALDTDSAVELDSVRTDRFEHEELQELLGQCVQEARQAAAQARSGLLEPRPDTCAYRGGCSYPSICRCER
jgi:RecB family exonuclease